MPGVDQSAEHAVSVSILGGICAPVGEGWRMKPERTRPANAQEVLPMRSIWLGRNVLWRALAGAGLAFSAALTPVASAPAVTPVMWRAQVGSQAGQQAIQALAFFPTDVFVNVGDTITWNFASQEPHTVTFVPAGQTPPGAGAPATPDNSPFTGSELINSGVMTAPGGSYSIVFNATGDFNYLCLIHPKTMSARVHVNPAGSPYPLTQAFYDRQARQQSGLLLEDGNAIRETSQDTAQATGKVITGGGDAQSFVARFLPASKRIKVGDSVTWDNPDSITPHTVTFGPSPSTAPAGLDSAGHATISANPVTTTISSGLIGVRRALGTDFTVTFTAPGTYTYFCSLHGGLGMTGTIVVSNNQD
jgi:plastocyanin